MLQTQLKIEITNEAESFINALSQLSNQASNSPFTSLLWMKSWVRLPVNFQFIICFFDGKVVGVAGLCFKTQLRYGLNWQQAYLHRTGLDEFDQIWPECNDVVALPEYKNQVWQAVLEYFQQSNALELLVGLSEPIDYIENSQSLSWYKDMTSTSYARQLHSNFADINSLLNCLSRNSRSQLKRAINKVVAPVKIEQANTVVQALQMFDWASTHHKKRWHDSGFLNSHFVEFHKSLIRSGVDNKQVILLQATIGEQVAAVYYYFLQDKRVYFYLGSVNYDDFDDKYKIGLLSHCYAISHFAKLGFELYDFLAGEARYKASLSDIETEQCMYVIDKPAVKLKFIKALKSIKQIITRN
ncbi:GNAT family N-acetyltransferase [Catenovulum agarivorans]|uniref:GNAT family N-acetyltransferase n=1 Tax=Catenovulum agarivorans TaxID=1172192 RepID=UPI0002DF757E|nr:GNAT family N-acetyltransferase [Catenovulum agarivorans]